MFLLHVYTLTSIYHLNHLSFESSDLGAPIGLQETDHLTIRILSSFSKSSEAGEVKWGTPGGFFPEFATWTMGYAPRHRLEEEATFTSGDGEALHGLDILGIFGDLSIAHVTCPGPCYRRCCVFFLPSPRSLFWLRALVTKLTRKSRKLRVKPGNLALVLSTWCCFSSLSPFLGRIIMVMPGWGFDNFIRQERL